MVFIPIEMWNFSIIRQNYHTLLYLKELYIYWLFLLFKQIAPTGLVIDNTFEIQTLLDHDIFKCRPAFGINHDNV